MSNSTKRFWDANEALVNNEMSQAGRIALVAIMWVIGTVGMAMLWVCTR